MKDIFVKGSKKKHEFIVKENDIAQFENGIVHAVCATFTLARELEWSSRLFVLEMKDSDEEGIGTRLEIQHVSPALVGEKVEITATVESLVKNELICTVEANVGERTVAIGKTGQKIVKKEKLDALMQSLK